jgi:multimeric flavodoxin WrbA
VHNKHKTILVIFGSPRKHGDGVRVIEHLRPLLERGYAIELSYLFLIEKQIESCRGCLACMRKSESACPIQDSIPTIREQLKQADGFIFISPVYVHTVSGIMKSFFDRLCYWYHRPQFFGKPVLLMCTTELSGIEETLSYMKFPAKALGMHPIGSVGVFAYAFKNSDHYQREIEYEVQHAMDSFIDLLNTDGYPRPSFSDLVFFTKLKTKVNLHKDRLPYDYEYWEQQGWVHQNYFYPTKINPIHKFILNGMARLVLGRMRKKLDNYL